MCLISFLITIIVIIFILLLWCWNFLWNHPNYKIKKWQEIESKCKTGDLILFHPLDNYNPIFIGCYYGHIGIIYRESPNSPPYLFEAWNPLGEKFYPYDFNHGMAFTDLYHRLISYRGYIFYKELKYNILPEVNKDFYDFIYWAMGNMKYNPHVIQNGFKKLVFNDPLRINTNCSELVYLSLIKLGLLNKNKFIENRKYHLKWLSNLKDMDNGNKYLDPVYIWQEYFLIN